MNYSLTSRMVKAGYEVTYYNCRGHHVSGKEFDGELANCYQVVKLKRVPTIERKGLVVVTSSFFCCVLYRIESV